MKRYVSLLLVVMLMLTCTSALALNYHPCQDNEATFELLEETRISSPDAVKDLETNVGKTYVSHPVLDGYPAGTTFVYRSANLFGGRASARLNTNLVIFVDKHFDDKAAAKAYLDDLGVIAIIDEAIGSVVLVTPADGVAFGAADQVNYYALQTAMLAQKQGGTVDGVAVQYSDAEYFGGYGYFYVIGIDGGATFINDYVAPTFDFISRIAGLLLINGKMAPISSVAALVPVYTVNMPEAALAKYKAANTVNAIDETADAVTYFDQALPLRKVIVAAAGKSNAEYIKDAYYNMFIKAMRMPVIKRGLYTAGTPYQGYSFDQAPYSLCDRNAIINGKTEDGIYLFEHVEDRFADIKTSAGEYLQTWFEYLPEEVVNGTAPAGSIPLLLSNHGGGDDPRLYVDENGWLELAGKERIAIVAAEHQYIADIRAEALPALAQYMLDTYPALDASRVYVNGYSMGGSGTTSAINGKPGMFAAAVPMATGGVNPTEEQAAQYKDIDLPIMFSTSAFDNANPFNSTEVHLGAGFERLVNRYIDFNELGEQVVFDYETYPVIGMPTDRHVVVTINGEYQNNTWYLNNADGVPMLAVTVTDGMVHALYGEYAKICWNFMKHYSRDLATGAVIYNEFVD